MAGCAIVFNCILLLHGLRTVIKLFVITPGDDKQEKVLMEKPLGCLGDIEEQVGGR